MAQFLLEKSIAVRQVIEGGERWTVSPSRYVNEASRRLSKIRTVQKIGRLVHGYTDATITVQLVLLEHLLREKEEDYEVVGDDVAASRAPRELPSRDRTSELLGTFNPSARPDHDDLSDWDFSVEAPLQVGPKVVRRAVWYELKPR